MKLLFIVVVSLLAVGYARDQEAELATEDVKKVIILARGVGRGRKLLSCGNNF